MLYNLEAYSRGLPPKKKEILALPGDKKTWIRNKTRRKFFSDFFCIPYPHWKIPGRWIFLLTRIVSIFLFLEKLRRQSGLWCLKDGVSFDLRKSAILHFWPTPNPFRPTSTWLAAIWTSGRSARSPSLSKPGVQIDILLGWGEIEKSFTPLTFFFGGGQENVNYTQTIKKLTLPWPHLIWNKKRNLPNIFFSCRKICLKKKLKL